MPPWPVQLPIVGVQPELPIPLPALPGTPSSWLEPKLGNAGFATFVGINFGDYAVKRFAADACEGEQNSRKANCSVWLAHNDLLWVYRMKSARPFLKMLQVLQAQTCKICIELASICLGCPEH